LRKFKGPPGGGTPKKIWKFETHNFSTMSFNFVLSGAASRGGGRDWGNCAPPLFTKVIFVNRLKPMRKYLGYGGEWVTNHTWISTWVCHKWLSKTWSNLYFIQLL